LYLELNEPQRALATVQGLADRYSPGDEPQEVLYYQGLSYLGLARYEDAVESLGAAVVRDRPTPEILCRLAQARWSAGHAAEALAAVEQALALDPNHPPSRRFLEQIQLAHQPDSPQRR
jgi:tetratricopeptide (TPR) repeat protein